MRNLILVRHGKSDWEVDCGDYDRPLNKRGKRDVPEMGKWIASFEVKLDFLISSPAERTRRTAKAIAKALGFKSKNITYRPDVYMSTSNGLLSVLTEYDGNLLLVGHNPGIQNLVDFLTEGDPPYLSMVTAAVIRFEVAGDLKPGSCEFVSYMTPKSYTDPELRSA